MSGAAAHSSTTVRPGRTLAELAVALGAPPPAGARSLAVRSLQTDSRAVEPGDLFFAVPGAARDGLGFVADALARGAIAIVAPRGSAAAVNPRGAAARGAGGVPWIEVENVRRAKAVAAHAFHGDPSRDVACVGVTGTKGKTTSATLIHSILLAAARSPTLIGTIEERVWGGTSRPSEHTTPDALRLAALLAQARAAGGRSAVMEVSSHALDQERATGVRFRAALFTQLAREHLDYHPDVAAYRDAKAKLFEGLDGDAVAVVNGEDAVSHELVARSRARLLVYGQVPGAHVRADAVELGTGGLSMVVRHVGGRFAVASRLVGRHNLMNVLGACAVGLALGIDGDTIARGVAALAAVPGRLEAVRAGQEFDVLVDYAHTDDALEKVLRLLKPLATGRVFTVFGCGGDRDRTKRPRMGNVAARLSDRVFLTSDNPRSEDPAAIARDVLAGIPAGCCVEVELDRRVAIEHALADARRGDVVLIAGKGHEDYQIVGQQRFRFDDRAVARELLCRLSR
jgi:UDP-N-acetylmuramoyl-L-alanyl-D-glutamate--2,6-diaminopimelate ligase